MGIFFHRGTEDIESQADLANVKLQQILSELQDKFEAGEAVALDAATITALQAVTATVSNFPTNYPDSAAEDSLDALELLTQDVLGEVGDNGTLLGQIHDEAVLTSNSLSAIDGYYQSTINPQTDVIAGATTDTATNTSLIVDNTSNIDSGIDAVNTKLTTIDGHVDGLETLGTAHSTKLDTLHTDNGVIETKLDTGNTNTAGIITALGSLATASNQATSSTKLDTLHTDLATTNTNTASTAANTQSIANKLGTEGVTPPTITGTGIFGYVRAAYEELLLMYGRMTDGTQKSQITNGIASVEINAAGDNNSLYVHQQTKTQTLTFTSANSSSTAINCDGYDTIEVIVTAGSTLATPKFANDGVAFVAAQWYRWTDISGPFTSAVTHSNGVKYTCKVAGHYFRIENTTLTTNPTTVDVILSSKPFVPPVETVTGTLAVTQSTSPWLTTDKGATGSVAAVAMTTAASTVKAANSNRKEIIIVNATTADLYLYLSVTGTVTTALYSVKIAAGGQHIEQKYTGIISGLLSVGTGNVMVTEIT
jgi:hypothetical protein